MKLFKMFKRGQKGFTLVELMVVMAIIAVLAAIVIPPVTGTKQVSSDTQVKQDGTTVQTAVAKFNSDSNAAETITTITGTPGLAAGETISNKWPERYWNVTPDSDNLSNTCPGYSVENGLTYGSSSGNVKVVDKNGTTDMTVTFFTTNYNPIDFAKLTNAGYLQQLPSGANAMFPPNNTYHNYLWVLKKVPVSGPTGVAVPGAGRVVELYSLQSTTSGLIYQRIY